LASVHSGTSKASLGAGCILRLFLGLIHLSCRAVNAGASDLSAPDFSVRSSLIEIVELLTSEPALAHVRDLIFDTRFVLRTTHAGNVRKQTACLHVLQK
jgi:hypothetical protein